MLSKANQTEVDQVVEGVGGNEGLETESEVGIRRRPGLQKEEKDEPLFIR